MRLQPILLVLVLLLAVTCKDKPTPVSIYFTTDFERLAGGSNYDRGWDIATYGDGGMIVAGQTLSHNSGDLGPSHGFVDAWLVRFNPAGDLMWSRNYGGLEMDLFLSVVALPDGGALAVGHTNSNDGDVKSNHGKQDIWLVRVNSNGAVLWQKTFGGSNWEEGNGVVALSDGSFVIAGTTASGDGDVSGNNGGADTWILKVDANGNLVWQKNYGDSADEGSSSISATSDGGFVIAGSRKSTVDISDGMVLRLDASGNKVWQKTFGGSQEDQLVAVHAAANGSMVAAGYSFSTDGDLTVKQFAPDNLWVIKLNDAGEVSWKKSFGGNLSDRATGIVLSSDGNYLLSGSTTSNDGDVAGNHGKGDGWIIRVNASSGALMAQQTFGVSDDDGLNSLALAPDGSFVAAGFQYTKLLPNSPNPSNEDLWVIRFR